MPNDLLLNSTAERGTVLVETLLAALLATILIGFFMHADLAVNKRILRWIGLAGLEQLTQSVRRQLQRDFLKADSVLAISDQEFRLVYRDGAAISYDFRSGRLDRNGRALLPQGVVSEQLLITSLNQETLSTMSIVKDYVKGPFVLTLELVRNGKDRCTIILPVRPFRHRQI
jgi:hypothetical protein